MGAAQEHEDERAQRLRRQAEKEAAEGAWVGQRSAACAGCAAWRALQACRILMRPRRRGRITGCPAGAEPDAKCVRLKASLCCNRPPSPPCSCCRGGARRAAPHRHRRLPACRHQGRLRHHSGGQPGRHGGQARLLQRAARGRRLRIPQARLRQRCVNAGLRPCWPILLRLHCRHWHAPCSIALPSICSPAVMLCRFGLTEDPEQSGKKQSWGTLRGAACGGAGCGEAGPVCSCTRRCVT